MKRKALEGSGLQAASVVWWAQLLGVVLGDEPGLSVPAGRQFGLKLKCMGLGCCLKRDTSCLVLVCMGRFQESTWFLPSFAQSFVLTLAEILSYQLRKAGGLAGEGLFLAAQGCSPWGR